MPKLTTSSILQRNEDSLKERCRKEAEEKGYQPPNFGEEQTSPETKLDRPQQIETGLSAQKNGSEYRCDPSRITGISSSEFQSKDGLNQKIRSALIGGCSYLKQRSTHLKSSLINQSHRTQIGEDNRGYRTMPG